MKYTKTNVGPYNLHVINTDKFKTIKIKINFKKLMTKKDITFRRFLSDLLLESSKNYPTKRDLAIACENLYDLGMGINTYLSGNYNIISFSANYIDSRYLEEDIEEDVIKFISDVIFNPDVNNGAFNNKSFDMIKKQYNEELESYKDNPKKYSLDRMYEEMDNKSVLSYRTIGYQDDLDSITPTNIYEYYENVLKSDLIDIFVIGNVDNNKMKRILLDNFKIKTIKKSGISHSITHKNYHKRAKVKKEEADFTQSQLVIGMKTIDLTDFEQKYVSPIYSYILGGGPSSKLFKNVREKKSFCYSINSQFKGVYNICVIRAGINKKNYDDALKVIKKQIKDMEKGIFEEKEISAGITTYIDSCKQISDYQAELVNLYMNHEYLGSDLIDDRITNIKKVTKEDIINFAKKVHLDTIFLLEGGSHDEA